MKKILIISLELAAIAGALWYLRQRGDAENILNDFRDQFEAEKKIPEKQEEPFPELASQITRTYNWEYKNIKYSLSEKLYQSSYEYYRTQSKVFSYERELPANWEDQYYGTFLDVAAKDESISTLVNDLRALGQKNRLNEDQIVELAMAFVQSIPYDDAKAKDILAKIDGVSMRYPYEVLFENLGVCSDKSLLAAVILRQMGYGAALFAYEQDNHMAIGIQCPKNSSTYGDGYCFAETTSSGNKIGILPSFDAEKNKAIEVGDTASLTSAANLKSLGQVKIYQQTSGKEYYGVASTQKLIIEIETLKKSIAVMLSELQSLKKAIADKENELEEMKKELEKYQKAQKEEKFIKLLDEYNNSIEDYQKDVKKFNKNVALYNQSIARYNTLIKQ